VLNKEGAICRNPTNKPKPINEGAAPGDQVSGRQLEMRVHRQDSPKIRNPDNKPKPINEGAAHGGSGE
jgi:hypothetical protein